MSRPKPKTGDGRTEGRKPKAAQVTQRTSGGAVLWKITAALWGARKKRKT